MALIQQEAGDYSGSNETITSSLSNYNPENKGHYPHLSYNYNLLGTNCLNLSRYNDAIRYYTLSLELADSVSAISYRANLALAYQKKKEYDSAIKIYEQLLQTGLSDTIVYTQVRSNLARAFWQKDPSYQPLKEFHEARQLREIINYKMGLNASYSHLSDYYRDINPDSSLYYAKKMFAIAKELNSADDQAEALEKLVRLSSGTMAKEYFDRYDFLNDSIHLSRTKAGNEFADIRFNAEEERAGKLLLEKDNSQKRLRITTQRIIIYCTLGLFIASVVLGIRWFRKRKRVQEIETKNAIRESELKTSKKVHDVVANGLYRIMTDLEHQEDIQKEKLLDNIEQLYEQSRDISYNQPLAIRVSFHDAINEMLTSFATDNTKVLVVGNNDTLWEKTSEKQREEVLYVLQELMVNMRKHSESGNVVIRFQQTNEEIAIHYKDDGKGFSPDYQPGNGMKNTGNRILAIGGQIIFDGKQRKGLSVDINFPLSQST